MTVKDVINQAISAVEVCLGIVLSLAHDVVMQAYNSMRSALARLGSSGAGNARQPMNSPPLASGVLATPPPMNRRLE